MSFGHLPDCLEEILRRHRIEKEHLMSALTHNAAALDKALSLISDQRSQIATLQSQVEAFHAQPEPAETGMTEQQVEEQTAKIEAVLGPVEDPAP